MLQQSSEQISSPNRFQNTSRQTNFRSDYNRLILNSKRDMRRNIRRAFSRQ